MPCTQYEDQDQQTVQGGAVRSTVRRNFAALRATYHRSLQDFERHPVSNRNTSQNQHHHGLNRGAISSDPNRNEPHVVNDPDDLTEQIRISVRDAHISHGTFANEFGGNISDVLESFDENILSYSNNRSQQEYIHDLNLADLVGSRAQNNGQFAHHGSYYVSSVPSASTSNSSSRTDSLGHRSTSATTPPRLLVHNAKDFTNESPGESQCIRFNDMIEKNVDSKQEELLKSPAEPVAKQQEANDNDEVNTFDAEMIVESVTDEVTSKNGFSNGLNASSDASDDCEIKQDIINIIASSTKPRQIGVIRDYLFNGSSFSGYQKSKNGSYEVNVKIQYVDQSNSYLCGYLCIAHLTKNHPSLTTFFEGEIISERHPFLTRKWEASEEIDLIHWCKFDDFLEKYSSIYNLDSFDYDTLKDSEYIYMRWKERFLVPDHTIKYVEGASYAGFYYTCYSKRTSEIKGYYFHINSEHFER